MEASARWRYLKKWHCIVEAAGDNQVIDILLRFILYSQDRGETRSKNDDREKKRLFYTHMRSLIFTTLPLQMSLTAIFNYFYSFIFFLSPDILSIRYHGGRVYTKIYMGGINTTSKKYAAHAVHIYVENPPIQRENA